MRIATKRTGVYHMKYYLLKKRLKNKKYKIKRKKDIIAENTAKMSLFSKDLIDIILKL